MKQELPQANNQLSLIDNHLKRPSTLVERTLQIHLFMQNKPNFLHFSPENEDCAAKQTQFKPNSKPNKANFGPIIRVAKSIQTQTNPIFSRYWFMKMRKYKLYLTLLFTADKILFNTGIICCNRNNEKGYQTCL